MKLYNKNKFIAIKPEIWGNESPDYFNDFGIYRYEKLKLKKTKNNKEQILRRKVDNMFKKLNLEDAIQKIKK